MKAKDIMVDGANLVTVTPEDSIFTAIRLMLSKRISGLPVVEGGDALAPRIVGIVSEGDFLRRRETQTLRRRARWLEFLTGPGKLAEEYARAASRKIADVMTAPVMTVGENAPISDVVQLMEQRGIRRVPVVRGDILVGIITRANILRALVQEAGRPLPLPADDAAIKERVQEEFRRQPWMSATMIDVGVKDGVVRLSGAIIDARERNAMIVAAQTVPGVKLVEDDIVFVEPLSGMVIPSPEDEKQARVS